MGFFGNLLGSVLKPLGVLAGSSVGGPVGGAAGGFLGDQLSGLAGKIPFAKGSVIMTPQGLMMMVKKKKTVKRKKTMKKRK